MASDQLNPCLNYFFSLPHTPIDMRFICIILSASESLAKKVVDFTQLHYKEKGLSPDNRSIHLKTE